MKKKYIILLIVILIIVFAIFYIKNKEINEPVEVVNKKQNISINNLIGINYPNNSSRVKDFNIIKTRTMDIGGEGSGLVSYVENGDQKVLLFEFFNGENENNESLLKIIDAVLLPTINENETLAFYCGNKLENDSNLIQDVSLVAIVKKDNNQIWTDVKDVWKANLETNKIEKISNLGIICHNELLSPYYPGSSY